MREFKDSGIEWIGEIPKNWNVMRFKNVCNIYTGNSITDSLKDNYTDSEDAIPYISSKDIIINTNTADYDNGLYIKTKDLSFKRARKGSTLMCVEGGSAGRKKTLLKQQVAFVNKLCCFNGNDSVDDRYLYYFLCSPNYENEFKRNISGLIGGVSVTKLINFNICLPPLAEQQHIADYLDTKCEQIDLIASGLVNQISALESYKKSLITETVTKGLDKDVEMKDSGIEWLGKIPSLWEVTRLKYISKIYGRIGFRGYTEKDLVDEEEGAITLSPSNFNDMKMNFNKCAYISWNKYYESPEIMINNGDILFVKTGSTYGKNCKVEGLPQEATINPQLVVFKEINVNKNFFSYVMQSQPIRYQSDQAVVGGTIPTMSQKKIENFQVIMPPMEEQQEIADYLDKRCSKIDEILELKRKQLETLNEYKKSLIYEYITGKKEVK